MNSVYLPNDSYRVKLVATVVSLIFLAKILIWNKIFIILTDLQLHIIYITFVYFEKTATIQKQHTPK